MEGILKLEKKYDMKYIVADFGVRYFEDASLNGVEENDESPKMPCIKDGRWVIKVDLDNGQITNWEKGNTAKIYYKVCDDGKYAVLDSENNVITNFESYVPNIFAIDDSGFGDYVYLTIDREGFIKNWHCTPNDIAEMVENAF